MYLRKIEFQFVLYDSNDYYKSCIFHLIVWNKINNPDPLVEVTKLIIFINYFELSLAYLERWKFPYMNIEGMVLLNYIAIFILSSNKIEHLRHVTSSQLRNLS